MLTRPNPMLLVMGGGSLLTCSGFLVATKLAPWMRYSGAAALVVLGLASIAAGLHMAFKKKPEAAARPKRKAKPVELDPATRARRERASPE